MMYGSRETFEYVECSDCGCLQIGDIPEDLGRHYPSDYYSQRPRKEPDGAGGLKGRVMQAYCRALAIRPHALSTRAMQQLLPRPFDFEQFGTYLVESHLKNHTEGILDVGCGSSPHRLAAFKRCGFPNVSGIDPFIPEDCDYHGIPVKRTTLDQVTGRFGLIMFHHSLEHVPDPVAELTSAAKLLRPGGACLVRIPVMGTYFWRHFGVNWVELDAPRHLHLFSQEAIGRLAARTGFTVRKTVFDSEDWELEFSLRHQRGFGSREADPADADLSPDEARQRTEAYRKTVDQLNRLGCAGRACFYLVRE